MYLLKSTQDCLNHASHWPGVEQLSDRPILHETCSISMQLQHAWTLSECEMRAPGAKVTAETLEGPLAQPPTTVQLRTDNTLRCTEAEEKP